DSSCTGQATRFSAVTGRPPMAYTSEKALAAPIRPQSKGSSTMGVKKSTVWMMARPSAPGSANTAASSPVAGETSTSGGYSVGVRRPRTWARSLGASLHAQPAPWLYLVSRTSSRNSSSSLGGVGQDLRRDQLDYRPRPVQLGAVAFEPGPPEPA